ncbi:MAG: hypothetical protein JWM19_1066, partial [Actinomycetia bacterium]|nr:hypothetical protein [Actinomycetes bacterium]
VTAVPAHRLAIAQQALGLRSVFPDTEPVIKRDRLSWTGRLQPCELSRIYTVQITYTRGQYPVVRVLDPQLRATETGFLPHTYNDKSLCLHDAGQWAEHMLIVDTIVPWTAEWLLHYEVWLATGRWLGDQDTDTQLPSYYNPSPALLRRGQASRRRRATPAPPR